MVLDETCSTGQQSIDCVPDQVECRTQQIVGQDIKYWANKFWTTGTGKRVTRGRYRA